LGVALLINWLFYRLIGLATGGLLAALIMALTYYLSLRRLVVMLAFPGTTFWMRKSMENDYCKSMAQGVYRQFSEFKSCLEMFSGPVPQDAERTEYLNAACQKVLMVITSLEAQIDAQL